MNRCTLAANKPGYKAGGRRPHHSQHRDIEKTRQDRAGSRDSSVFERSRKTAKLGDGYVQRFGQLIDSAVRASSFAEAQQLQLLRMRLIRDYSGIWLLVNRPSS